MSYMDGFVIAVPKANKQKFIDHAEKFDRLFIEYGALRVVECWQDDVAKGKTTDFFQAVKVEDGEAVVFSWIEWPDKETRNTQMTKMMEDPRMDPEEVEMPFDGMRMIYGGFDPVYEITKYQLIGNQSLLT